MTDKNTDDAMSLEMKQEAEGGCGVIGFASSVAVAGKHLLAPLRQMKNRGNGKGGGVAIFGLSAKQLGVSEKILREDYLIQLAYLEPSSRDAVEKEFLKPFFDLDHVSRQSATRTDVPQVYNYFCRVKPKVLENFKNADDFVFQNTYALNKKFYHSLTDKKAFVLSHGKDMMVFKIVGYADEVIAAYGLENLEAHIWIGHHRYPTKGRVWHPGGAHPFIGMSDALIHNGDFSNYHSICEYLAQRNIYPLFLTDTEVAVYLFDLWRRVYGYPLEYVIEALAPTTERDFHMLPPHKQNVYRQIQAAHIHGSPDGPWFFIVGSTENNAQELRLLGITDTSMLRPQVFALYKEKVSIGLIASERQAIDACLKSLSVTDSRFAAKADLYWNARGGSHTDGGAFIFKIARNHDRAHLTCADKFNTEKSLPAKTDPEKKWEEIKKHKALARADPKNIMSAREALTWDLDHWHLTPYNHDGRTRALVEETLNEILRLTPALEKNDEFPWALLDFASRQSLRAPKEGEQALVMDAAEFSPEGENSAASWMVRAYKLGWKHLITFDWRGQRFCGCGLGANSEGLRVDVYGNPGDYLASGLDGAEIYVHAAAQDQVAQIMKSGKLVIYGDVGQTFMYAAKGGEAHVLGNAAGRPLINAVGRPRVVINGTCLDYLAESFMAGDPHNGGGFVIVNGIAFDHHGRARELPTPYPGGNLMSLASGGAVYIRDPQQHLGKDQLNGGKLAEVNHKDRDLLWPYLRENEKLFGISIEETLLKPNGKSLGFSETYRKVVPERVDTEN